MQPTSLKEEIKEILWSLCDTEELVEFYVDKIMAAMSPMIIKVNVSICTGCGDCIPGCPTEAISLQTITLQGRSKQVAQISQPLCYGCGRCEHECLYSAISVSI